MNILKAICYSSRWHYLLKLILEYAKVITKNQIYVSKEQAHIAKSFFTNISNESVFKIVKLIMLVFQDFTLSQK